MPTERKIELVDEMRRWMETCTIAISTDYTGMSVSGMTEFRKALREKEVQFKIVKNTLALLAADAAGRPEIKGIIEGPTGIAFSDGEPAALARALADYIKASRAPIRLKSGVMGHSALSAEQVNVLATLPPLEQLIAQLLGQMKGPINNLVYTLNAPISNLARVLHQHATNLAKSDT